MRRIGTGAAAGRAARCLALLLGAVFAVAGARAAGEDLAAALKDAQAALAAGEYATAYPLYLRAAEDDGNPLAQFTVAMFHQLGWGRPVDAAAACAWHEKASAGGIPASAHLLAECFENGTGRPADAARAAAWYERAAELGHYVSLCSLADLYMHGEGVPRDPRKGLESCSRAASMGSVPAQLKVGRYLLEGDPSIRDPRAAHGWFETAAAGSAHAQYYLGVIHRDGLGQDKDLLEARYWFESAASRGYVPAYLPTARLYFEASPDLRAQPPSAEDLAKAYLWLSATARRSDDVQAVADARAMLDQVLAVMPATWVADLDAKVTAHLEAVPPSR